MIFLAVLLLSGCGKKAEEFVFDDSEEDVEKVEQEYAQEETDKAEPDEPVKEEPEKPQEKPEEKKETVSQDVKKDEAPKNGPLDKNELAQMEKILNTASCNSFLQCEYDKPGVDVSKHANDGIKQVKCVSGNITNGVYEIFYETDAKGSYKPSFRVRFMKVKDKLDFLSNEWYEKDKAKIAGSLYDDIIQQYAVAVYENWDPGTLQMNGLSYLCGMSYDDDSMNRIGYYLHDVDKNGVDELFIGEKFTADYKPSIYQVYTVADGELKLLIEGGERDRYYLSKDDTFYNEGSSSASSYAVFHFNMDAFGALSPVDGVIYDGSAAGPYFSTVTCDWDITKAKPVDQTYFDNYVSKAEGAYVNIGYTPLSNVKILKPDLKEPERKVFSDEELCKMALDHYERQTGSRPGNCDVDSVNGDLVTLHLYDDMEDHTATAAWYEIDRKTGKGTDTVNGDKVDLNS